MNLTRENIVQFIDHTSLKSYDSDVTINSFITTLQATRLRPATVVVYPSMVEAVALALGESKIGITAVCGSFPSGLTYLEVKLLEVAMAIENGAEEIDIVINLGAILNGEYDKAQSEIRDITNEIDGEATLKVILETGEINDEQTIYNASMVAMQGGANFIKTSTGKSIIGATTDSVKTMCRAIKEYHNISDVKVGIKISGGIDTFEQAILYFDIVKENLGEEWLTPDLLRIGSSKLLFNI